MWEMKQCHFYNRRKSLFAANKSVFSPNSEKLKICGKAVILAFNNEAARNPCNKVNR